MRFRDIRFFAYLLMLVIGLIIEPETNLYIFLASALILLEIYTIHDEQDIRNMKDKRLTDGGRT